MATVSSYTKAKMDEIVDATVVGAHVDSSGDIILETHDGGEVNGGSIYPSAPVMVAALLDFFYPIGELKMSIVNTNPGTIIGGTWVAWGTGRVPVGVDTGQTEFDTVEETGGAKTVTLTSAQSGVPAHNHTQNSHNHTQNSHNHTPAVGGQFVTNRFPSGGANWSFPGPAGDMEANGGGTTGSATATNNADTATNISATATNNNNTPADAASAHNNLQPYITCYFWKRTA